MSFGNRLKNTFLYREEIHHRLEDEAGFHVEMRERDLLARGFSPEDAAKLARKQFGNALRHQENAAEQDILPGLDAFLQDTRIAVRRLARSPLFLLSSIVLLAVCVGLNSAVFSVLDVLFFRGLPYPGAEQLYVLREYRDGRLSNSNPQRISDWRTASAAFTHVASFYFDTVPLSGPGGNRTVSVMRLDGDWVSTLNAPILAGRNIAPGEFRGGRVALLTHRARHLTPLGGLLRLGSESFTVVGIVDDRVGFGEEVDILTPIGLSLLEGSRKAGFLTALGRLSPAVNLNAAQSMLDSIAARLARQYPDTDAGTVVRLTPARAAWAEEARQPAIYMQAAAGLLLLITLLNLGGLLAARTMERAREDAIRVFLGAGRWRILRLHLVESMLLVTFALLLSLALAPAFLEALQLLYANEFAPIRLVTINARTMVFALLVSLISVAVFTAICAWQASRDGNSRASGQHRVRQGLVIVQSTIGILLLAAAIQLTRNFAELRYSPLGFREQGLLSARAYLSWDSDATLLRRFIDQAQSAILQFPGVSDVAVVDRLPLEGNSQDSPLFISGQAEKTRDSIGIRMATTNAFALLGVPLLAGALPTDDNAITVNSAFASRYLGSQPLGRSVSIDNKNWYRVAAVVGNVRYAGRETNPRAEIYLSPTQTHWPLLTFVIRTSDPAARLNDKLRETLSRLHPELDYRGALPLSERLDEIVKQPRRQRDLIALFGLLALALVITGVYGVMAGEMLRRRHEFGIRLAIGAHRGHILGIGLGRSLRLAAWALLMALAASAAFLDSWLQFRCLGESAVVVLVGLAAAGLIPAWRTARRDPLVSLRQL